MVVNKYVELDYELAVALANVTEGAARSTVLKVTQVEASHGFVAWQALADGYAPKSQPVLATSKRCKDAKDLKVIIIMSQQREILLWTAGVAELSRHLLSRRAAVTASISHRWLGHRLSVDCALF